MKIFSNFDTNLPYELLTEAQEQYGKDNVIFIRRNRIYLAVRHWFPLMLVLMVILPMLYAYVWLLDKEWVIIEVTRWLLLGISLLWIAYYIGFCLYKLIDYKLDFVIITPLNITAYDQSGLFDRNTTSIDLYKIKTIAVYNSWWLSSIFGYGSIKFLSEWDTEAGDIVLKFISNPNKLRNNIESLLKNSLQNYQMDNNL